MAKLMPVAFQLKKTYHSLLAVRPSKKARCPPLGVVANTMFLFALDHQLCHQHTEQKKCSEY